jgi:hypothetical protein
MVLGSLARYRYRTFQLKFSIAEHFKLGTFATNMSEGPRSHE